MVAAMEVNNTILIRKSVHFFTGCLVFALTYFLDRDILLVLYIAGALFSFLTFNYQKLYSLHKTKDSSLGTLFYPLGVISSFLILYNQPLFWFRTAIMVLTLSDIAAWWAGRIKNNNLNFRVLHDKKSLFGVIAYAIITLIIFRFYLPPVYAGNLPFLLLALFISISLESISSRGSDNLTIPLGLSVFFRILENQIREEFLAPDTLLFITGILLLFAAGSILLFKWNLLSRTGSLSAGLLGVYFVSLPGFIWIFPVLFFFITSALLTKLNSRLLKGSIASSGRNVWQVMANIIWALLSSVMFLISQNEIFIYFFIVLVAAVTADTWASEVGPLVNKRCLSVADLKMHPSGTTGGVSAGGTFAALAGSASVSVISMYLFFGEPHIRMTTILAISGFLACFADSFLGAFAEEKFLKWKLLTQNKHRFSPNDLVNILGSVTAPLFFLLLYHIAL